MARVRVNISGYYEIDEDSFSKKDIEPFTQVLEFIKQGLTEISAPEAYTKDDLYDLIDEMSEAMDTLPEVKLEIEEC